MKHISTIVIPIEHRIFILKSKFVFLSSKLNDAKNSNIINNNDAKPIIPSLIPPFKPFPTNASKHPIMQDKIYFTIFKLSTS